MAFSIDLWNRAVLPSIADHAMASAARSRLRAQTTSDAHGRVLEIGIGSGHNLGYYPRSVDLVIGIDPSLPLLRRAYRRAAWMTFPVQLRHGFAERLPVEAGSVDVVISTWTLCAVEDPAAALQEVRRVLRPDGIFRFCERCQSDEGRLPWLTPIRRHLPGGRWLDQPIDRLVDRAGLEITHWSKGRFLPGSGLRGWQCLGRARVR